MRTSPLHKNILAIILLVREMRTLGGNDDIISFGGMYSIQAQARKRDKVKGQRFVPRSLVLGWTISVLCKHKNKLANILVE